MGLFVCGASYTYARMIRVHSIASKTQLVHAYSMLEILLGAKAYFDRLSTTSPVSTES